MQVLEPLEKVKKNFVNRRKFIKLFGLSGLTALFSACGTSHFLNKSEDEEDEDSAAATATGDDEGEDTGQSEKVTVYRLSARKAKDTACKNHAYHWYFKDENSIVRAHDGCSCRITTQSISQTTFDEIFSGLDGGAAWVS